MTAAMAFIRAYRWNRQHGEIVGLSRRRSLRNAWKWTRDWRHQRADEKAAE